MASELPFGIKALVFVLEAFFEWFVAVPVRGALVFFLAIGLDVLREGLGSLRLTATFLVLSPVTLAPCLPPEIEDAAEVKLTPKFPEFFDLC